MDQFEFLTKIDFWPSGRDGSYFYRHYHNSESPPECIRTRLDKLEFFRKIYMQKIKGTFEVILMLKFVIRAMWNPTRDISWVFFWNLKNLEDLCPLSFSPSRVHSWGLNTKNFEFLYTATSTEQVTSFQLHFISNRIKIQKGVGQKVEKCEGVC